MDDNQMPESAEPLAQPSTTPWWKRRSVIAGAAVVVAAAAAAIALSVAGGSSPAKAAVAATSSAAQIEMDGALTVPFLGSDLFDPQAQDAEASANTAPSLGDTCVTLGGFTDISEGAAVTVGDSTGKTVAIGALEAGQVTGTAGQPASCEFDFTIMVPAGQSEYTVTISHRGTRVFTPAQVQSSEIQLTLGTAGS